MIKVNIKRILKNISHLLFIVIAPLIIVIIAIILNTVLGDDDGDTNSDILFVSMDRGEYSKALYSEEQLKDEEYARKELENNNIKTLFIIPEDFSKKIDEGIMPTVEVVQKNDTKNIYVGNISDKIKNILMEKYLEKEGISLNYSKNESVFIREEREIDIGYLMVNLMLIYFLLLSSGLISEDIFMLRDKKILKRNLLSPHRERNVALSVIMTYFILQFISYAIFVSIAFPLYEKTLYDYMLLMISIALSVLFSLSLSLFFVRLSKSKGISSMLVSMSVMAMFFITMFGYAMPDSQIAKLAMFSPLTYITDIFNTGKLFPNAIISILISMALLTFGSLRIKDFVNS